MPLLIVSGIGLAAGLWLGRRTCSVVPVDGGPVRLVLIAGGLAAAAYAGHRFGK